MLRPLLLLTLLGSWTLVAAQQLVISAEADASVIRLRGVMDDTSFAEPVFHATWRMRPEGMSFSFLRTSSLSLARLGVDRLSEAAIGAYLDQHVRFTREGVTSDVPVARLVDDMNAIVRAAAVEFRARDRFTGCGPATVEALDRLVRIDWSATRHAVDASGGQDKYLAIYRFVQQQRDEFEASLRADLLPLATVEVLSGGEEPIAKEVRIPTVCGTVFDEEHFLCALDLTSIEPGAGLHDPALDSKVFERKPVPPPARVTDEPVEVAEPVRVRKRDRWLKAELDLINDRIDRMDQRKELWVLRDRIDDIEAGMTDLRMEMRELRDGMQEGPTDNPLADLSLLTGRNIVVRFARGSVDLDPVYRVVLNEVFEQLARNPADRVLITGYTDRSGDPALNLHLSEQRAKAVRAYLLQRGIATDRLLVNYYGDSRSTGRDPSERRVEVEWLR